MCCINKKRRVEYRFYDYVVKVTDEAEKIKAPRDYGWSLKRGWLVGYGTDIHEMEFGIGTYTVGIVENDDMGVDLVHPSHIKFVGAVKD